MPYEIPGDDIGTLLSGVDFDATSSTNIGVKLQSTGLVTLPSAGQNITGQMFNCPKEGEAVALRTSGVVIGIAAGAIAIGAQIEVDNAGKYVTKSSGVAIGEALEAGVDTKEFSFKLL